MSEGPGALVVGTGFGCLTHVRALRNAGFEVRALVGRDAAKTRERAERFAIRHPTTSLAEALALDVDLVAVATPPHSHAELVLTAVAAGKHVVCEKPFARDTAEAKRMLDAAEGAGIVHLLGTEFRYATGQALATRAIRNGVIGEPRLATHLLCVPMLTEPDAEVPGWWADAAQGGGWLGAQASHVLDEMRVMLGEIVGVSATLSNVVDRPWSAEDSFSVHFRTESGVAGILQSSVAAYGPPLMITRITGSKGSIWIDFDTVTVADATGQRTLEAPTDLVTLAPDPPADDLMVTEYDKLHAFGIDVAPYTRLYEDARSLIGGQPAPTDPAPATFVDGVANMAVLDAIRASAAGGGWITVEN